MSQSKSRWVKIDVGHAIDTPPPPPQWVIPGLERRDVGALVGPGGVSKSYLSLGTAAEIATGGAYQMAALSALSAPAPVLYLTAEESPDQIHRRLHALMAEQPADVRDLARTNVRVFSCRGSAPKLVSARGIRDVAEMAQIAEMAQDCALIIIDPLRRFHEADENDAGGMTAVVETLEALAMQSGAALLAVHHTTKSAWNGENAVTSRGTSAFRDGVRLEMTLSPPPEKIADGLHVPISRRRTIVVLEIGKINHGSNDGLRVLNRRTDGVLSRDADLEARMLLGPQSRVAPLRAIPPHPQPQPQYDDLEDYLAAGE